MRGKGCRGDGVPRMPGREPKVETLKVPFAENTCEEGRGSTCSLEPSSQKS